MFALALDLWQPAVISGASRAQWLANLAGRFGGVTPDVYVDFITKQAYQAGQPSVLTPDDALTCVCASTRYRDDSQGNWLSFAPNVLAYTNKGLRVWEARSNAIRNNSMQGAVLGVIGSGGAFPTNWGLINGPGSLSQQIVGVGTENGVDYVDYRLFGTSNQTVTRPVFEGQNVITSANGQTWAPSMFYKFVAGSLSGATLDFGYFVYDASNTVLSTNHGFNLGSTFGAAGSTVLTRYSTSSAIVDATAAYIRPIMSFNYSNGIAIDLTVRIGWPQLEQASFASPPIRTTSAAVTTAAEVVTLTHALTFGGAYSLYAAGIPAATLAYVNPQAIIQSDTGVDAQSVTLRRTNGIGTASALLTGGTGGSLIGAAWSQNAAGKLAAAVNAADQAISFNGGAAVTAALAALPTTPTGVHAGGQSSTNQWDGDITEFAIWASQRLPNASLITGTQ
jgi:hypothetical protein